MKCRACGGAHGGMVSCKAHAARVVHAMSVVHDAVVHAPDVVHDEPELVVHGVVHAEAFVAFTHPTQYPDLVVGPKRRDRHINNDKRKAYRRAWMAAWRARSKPMKTAA